MIGTRLAHYEITAHLGSGGFGDVYQATDSKLGRSVAIKLLPAAFASDAERLSRFRREAQVLASLNHPNIAQIFGLEEFGTTRCIVMELVEGETLQARIKRGPVPVEEALTIAKQIAEALEAAHEKGVIHRDLKPGNVMLTGDGKVKVLDFGLAKVYETNPSNANLSNSPTRAGMAATNAGVILGTAAYMSPEQARGKEVDRRTDIFAFGAMLYEMMTGRAAFEGEDLPEILGAVLKSEPDWTRLPSEAPQAIHKLLRLCLRKDVKKRRQTATDVRIDIEEVLGEPAIATPTSTAAPARGSRPAWIASLAVAAVLIVAMAVPTVRHLRERPPPARALRYTLEVPENGTLHSMAVSPDGRFVAIAAEVLGKRQLWLRALDGTQAQLLPATDDAAYPFWSPDSRNIGFFAQGKLKKIAAAGGSPQSLCDANNGRGGSWNRENVIIFSPSNGGGTAIQRISAAGGDIPSDVTKTKGSYVYPLFLPNGGHFLYEVRQESPDKDGIYFSSLDGSDNRRVLPDVSSVVFALSLSGSGAGHLLFVRENTLMAQAFDADSAQLAGGAFPVAPDAVFADINHAPITVSETGLLLYISRGGSSKPSQIAWFDRAGKLLDPVTGPGNLMDPSISPDEKTIAFARNPVGLDNTGYEVWLRDLARGTETRLTFDGSANHPVWSPKGDRIAFSFVRGGRRDLYQKAASGTGESELLVQASNNAIVLQWARDFIVYMESTPKNWRDLWVFPVGEGAQVDRKPVPFLRTGFDEIQGQISPDSHWMAYRSDESGQPEVYVRPFPSGDGKWRISAERGQQPRWRGDGRELFFLAGDGKMMVAAVSPGPNGSFNAGSPTALFEAHMATGSGGSSFQYDVTADGKRFLVNTEMSNSIGAPASAPALNVVVNWTVGLKE